MLVKCSLALLLIWSGSAQALNIGVTSVLSSADNGNGNLLLTQQESLGQAATIQSLSFYVTIASGSLILGVYDATGQNGGPGNLLASTASFTPVVGWNTAPVSKQVSLPAANYWLAYLRRDAEQIRAFRGEQHHNRMVLLRNAQWCPTNTKPNAQGHSSTYTYPRTVADS
jgi:hypothetical protein